MNCFPYTTHTLNCKELRQCFQIVIVTDNIRLMIKLCSDKLHLTTFFMIAAEKTSFFHQWVNGFFPHHNYFLFAKNPTGIFPLLLSFEIIKAQINWDAAQGLFRNLSWSGRTTVGYSRNGFFQDSLL